MSFQQEKHYKDDSPVETVEKLRGILKRLNKFTASNI